EGGARPAAVGAPLARRPSEAAAVGHAAQDVLETAAATAALGVAHARPPGRARAATAEQPAEDVLEAPRARAGRRAEPRTAGEGPHLVVLLALLVVGQHGVGLADLLEARLGLGVSRVVVGVQLASELAVGLLDRGLVGVLGDAEDRVEVLLHPVLAGHVTSAPWVRQFEFTPRGRRRRRAPPGRSGHRRGAPPGTP